VWNQHLHRGLVRLKFEQSKYDPCVYYRGNVVMAIYIDDCLIIAPSDAEVIKVYSDLKTKFEVTNEGPIDEYLGVRVERGNDKSMKLSQPLLTQQILDEMGFNLRTKGRSTPALSSQILERDKDGKRKITAWDYRSILGKLNYLEKSTRPDIAYAVHQCARFAADPKECHVQAMLRIGRYLHATKDKGLIYQPKPQSFDLWCDADFSGNWSPETAHIDASTAKSRTGFVITFAGCPIAWTSKLQTEVALSTTEAEFIALSEGLRSAIPLISLVTELRDKGVPMTWCQPKIHCRVFEDNNGALELARTPKYRPRTKHINIKYWHFIEYVTKHNIEILPVDSKDQLADIFTKPLAKELFEKLRDGIQGVE
jgi:Reverse transcriptase (RNA-dependent DNA polymerase)